MKRWFAAIAICMAAAWSSSSAFADKPSEPARPDMVSKEIGPDLAMAGRSVALMRTLSGDLFAAGGSVDVLAEVSGDAVLAGGRLHVDAPVRQSIYAAGGSLSLSATAQRNLRFAGGTLEIAPIAHVVGNVTAGAGEVRVLGPVDGHVYASAGRALINAPVGGDVEVSAGRVELGPKAAVAGTLRYASGADLVRDPAARVAGPIERMAPMRRPDVPRVSGPARWIWTVGLLILAALLAVAAPRAYARVRASLQTRPVVGLLTGFVALVCLPVAALLLLVSIVGAPIAMLLMLAYPALLLLGYLSAGMALGAMALARWKPASTEQPRWLTLSACAGVLAITLAASLPWIGGIVAFAALLAGIGALLLAARDALAAGPSAGRPPTAPA